MEADVEDDEDDDFFFEGEEEGEGAEGAAGVSEMRWEEAW